ncbi:ionotropic receptor 25a [Bombus pyrosoma]|uniref:ionotropic receptor 25a n=1 Tax=Bombus pyrosoma TaxID=396416 RepID=UPI001CB9193D|nr:ionotropic receptor 25a [Bombus pyrosoma]XP_043589592.1 ionotropic receptor 25a [Bombus pyrosoma]XP_043589676.1 ionotropic receptor 25a [Bombus pyrosoma]XP_043589761.1 ionotropic receptor 25a [Bombus pyrosoma]XP_043589851.1 ionotropic receptor 25a [Bombus pyrosoma]XP_043589946.1 ionotropic receptor 25a [Bombus pyrosoma]
MRLVGFTIVMCGFLGFCGESAVYAQGNVVGNRGSTNTRAVNLYLINDEANKVANSSIIAALETIKEKYPNYLGEVWSVQVNESDVNETLDRICKPWDSAVKKGGTRVPDLVIDTTTAGLGAKISNSFTAALGIPTLSAQYGQEGDLLYWRNLNTDQESYLIQVMPPTDLIPEVIRQLCIQLNITNAAILYDHNFVMDHKYKSLLLNVPTRHVINEASQQVMEMRTQLPRLRDLDIVNYFILGDENTINIALEAAEALNFTGKKYGWFLLTPELNVWPRCECRNMNILFMKPEFNKKSPIESSLSKPIISSAFYYDLIQLGVRAMKSALDDGEWPVEPKHITCDKYDKTNTPERKVNFFNRLKETYKNMTPTYAGIKWGSKNGEHRAKFEMSINLVDIKDGIVSNTIDSGSWNASISAPLQITNNEVMNTTAVKSYRVVTIIHPPFVMYNEVNGTYYGFCIDLLDEIKDTVGFQYEIRETEDKRYGSLNPNGSWNGMMRELIDKRADIALGSVWVTAERERVVDFTVPYYDLVGLSIMMLKTKTTSSLFKFLTVLENEVWFCILAAYLFTSVLLWIFDRWSPYSYQNNREKYKNDDEKREFNLRECFWFCMTSLTPQGGGEAPKNLSGRLVAATWWLFGFIIIASYTANLAAFLTVSRLEIPIETLEDLSKQYKIQYAPVINSSAYIYFKRMAAIEWKFYDIWKEMSLNDSLSDVERANLAVWDYPVSDKYTKMLQAMEEAGFPASTEEALRRVRRLDSTNEFAYIEDSTTIKYLTMTNCDLVQVGEDFSRKPYAIAVQQGSPLKDQFNNAILILLNKRKLEKLKDTWWKKNPDRKDCDAENSQSDGISIQNIGGVFVVIFLGIIFACFTLAFEYWYYRHRTKITKINLNNTTKGKITQVKPLRFNLQPAPTHGFQNSQLRPRF